LQGGAGCGLVVFTTRQGEEDIYRALRAGAYGDLFKNTALKERIECILAVVQSNRWIPSALAAQLGRRVADRGLTVREMESYPRRCQRQKQQGDRRRSRRQRSNSQVTRDTRSGKAQS
jgi:DNA-binding NarL/FixJ family response regulator